MRSRFISKINKTSGKFYDNSECWEWTAAKDKDGYGVCKINYKNIRAHRYSYECMKGPVPEGLVLDHICKNKLCVNPDHLEAVTNKENLLRGNVDHNKHKTHCERGHEYSKINTYITKKGWRKCKRCDAINQARYRNKRNRLPAVSRNISY